MKIRMTAAVLILCPALAFAAEPEGQDMGHLMTTLVLQLAVIIISARIFGILFDRYLKQPRVLGELMAGMVIGPYALGAISVPLLGQPLFPALESVMPVTPELYGLAVVASIVLLFLAGLETDLPTFLKFSHIGSAVGLGGVVLSFTLGDLIAVLLLPGVDSFMSPTALFLGTLSTATSVGITARILSEKQKLSSPEGVTILAGAVLDDVLGIILLAVVVGIANLGASGREIDWGNIGLIGLKAFAFWIILTVLGILFAKKISRGLKWLRSNDAMAGAALGIALLLSGLAEKAGLAMIIGAYVVGLSLSQTDMSNELRERLHGVYQFLVPVFFCVMGMMVNFSVLKGIFLFGLVYTAGAILGKIVGCGLPALVAGFNLRGALRIGAGMLPRGEVTLIVAGIGLSTGVIGQDMFGVAIMTLLIASVIAPPILIKTFEGGSGLRKKNLAREKEIGCRIKIDFPSILITDFMRNHLVNAFQDEDFFVHRLNMDSLIYHIKKENIFITLFQKNKMIEFTTDSENRELVTLILAEEILELKDLLEGMENLQSPDGMCEALVSGLFGEKKQEN
jgi:Kef-type K+ transport system membrane component KefB